MFAAYDHFPDAVVILKKGSLVYRNELADKLLCIDKFYHGDNFTSVVCEDNRPLFKDMLIDLGKDTVTHLTRHISFHTCEKKGFYLKVTASKLENGQILLVFHPSIENQLREEKLRYRNLLNNLPHALIIHHNKSVRFINKKGVEYLGYESYREILGMDVLSMFEPFKNEKENSEEVENLLSGKSGTNVILKLYFKRTDGNKFPVEAAVSRVDYEGDPCIQLNVRNISEKEQAIKLLQETESRLQLLIETSPDIICFKDGKGRWLLANPADLKLFDLEGVDYFGKTDAELAQYTPFHRDAFLTCMETDEKAWQKGSISHGYEVIPTKHSGTKIYDVFKIPLFNPDKSRKGLVVIGRDVTKERNYLEELEAQKKMIQNYLDVAEVMLISLDAKGIIRMINRKGVTLLGYKNHKELTGKSWFDVLGFSEKELQQRKENYFKLMRGERDFFDNYEDSIILKSGKKLVIGWHNALLKDDNGNITGILSSGIDITESVENKNRLKNQQEQLELVLNYAPALLAYADKNVNYLYVNKAYADFYESTPEEMKGKPAHTFMPESYYKSIKPYIDRVLNGEEVSYQTRRTNKKGKTIYIKVNYIPHFDEHGRTDTFLAMLEDITEAKIHEIELKKALTRAETGDKLKKAFLNNLSHEFRTPMNAIVGFSDLMKEDPSLSPEVREQAEIISSGTHHLLDLLNSVIELSRIEAGEIPLNQTPVNINHLLRNVYNFYESSALMKELSFHLELPLPDEDALIISDENKLTRVIKHLVSNALKFTKKGSVSFGYTPKENEIEFFVKDTGIGIPAEQRDAIFEHFRQVEMKHTRHYGGTGVGLTISKIIVEKLGGKIWLKSVENKGSRFYFTVPVEKSHKISKDIYLPDDKREKRAMELFGEFKGKTVLVVEDEKDVRLYYKAVFKNTGINLHLAENGNDFTEKFDNLKNEVDLVLMDLRLEDISGLELTEKIKKERRYIPVIVQTAFAQPDEEKAALKAGADDFITKPLNKNELYRKMKILFDKSDLKDL